MMFLKHISFFILWQINTIRACVPDCDSKIYCQGEMMHDIQMMHMFETSKVFSDMQMKYPESEILKKYRKAKQNGPLDNSTMYQFVMNNFADDPLEDWVPNDYKEKPQMMNLIRDKWYRNFFLKINAIWKELGGRVSEHTKEYPELHSRLYVPNGIIKAGGRFTEMYYWDSFWIIQGLLHSDMIESARGMIENMFYLIKMHGHMPNANRVYYLQRSQPPMLHHMVDAYINVTNDIGWLRKNIEFLDTEFQYWNIGHMVTVEKNCIKYELARYIADTCSPRSEAYYMDMEIVKDAKDKIKVFRGLKTAAESGWDMSSRQVISSVNGSNIGPFTDSETEHIIYADLNALLEFNARKMSEWYTILGNETGKTYYEKKSNSLLRSIQNVLWDKQDGFWYDFNLLSNKSRKYFYAGNLAPLFTGSYCEETEPVTDVIRYLIDKKIYDETYNPNYYGVPTSLTVKGQWDMPNSWPPLNSFLIHGLRKTGHPLAMFMAYRMAQRWLDSMYIAYNETGFMFEKYNCLGAGEVGVKGHRLQYTPQKGFGWTNGVCIDILRVYGNYLTAPDKIKKLILT